jgi:uncharacterized protein YdeI (YjbR/CyaY-like superfamily)
MLHFRNGNEIKEDNKKPFAIPDELASAVEKANLRDNFDFLTLTSKREFTEHIDSAKREATKLSE